MNKTDCLICDQQLVYKEAAEAAVCSVCGNEFETEVSCKDGHFVCDDCHSGKAIDHIESRCVVSNETDPVLLAEELMQMNSIKMHGQEHHYLVPAVMLTAYYNHRGDAHTKKIKLAVAKKRAAKVPGGFCGFYGNCGAAVGTGIFMSIITETTPLSKHNWSLCNRMTADSLHKISEFNGPRCCKRDTFVSIQTALNFLRDEIGVVIDAKQPLCVFSVSRPDFSLHFLLLNPVSNLHFIINPEYSLLFLNLSLCSGA